MIQNGFGIVLTGMGVLCLIYFIYTLAKRVDFCIVWLLGGMLCLALGAYLRYRAAAPDGFRLPPVAEYSLWTVIAAGFLLFVTVEIRICSAMSVQPEQDLAYIIVLGAQVKGENIRRSLEYRTRRAMEYLQENPDTVAVLSGGQGDGELITEAECMRRWLTYYGIPEDRLLIEDRSTTTVENLQFSGKVIREDAALRYSGTDPDGEQEKEMKIGIVTNSFHVYRAMKLARKQGYRHVSGIPAVSYYKLLPHDMVREFFALVLSRFRGTV